MIGSPDRLASLDKIGFGFGNPDLDERLDLILFSPDCGLDWIKNSNLMPTVDQAY